MRNVKIFSDSTCDLSMQMRIDNDIAIVPLYITFNSSSYKDSVDMNAAELYDKVEELGVMPKTSAATPLDYDNAFRQYVDAGDDIVYIGLSSRLSSTVQNALMAAQRFEEGRVQVVDSLNLSTGVGILVMKAVELKKCGLSAYEISEIIKETVPKVRTSFTIDTYDYLYKGGRCSAVQGLVGSMLKIKPIIRLVDGNNILSDRARGRKNALSALLQEISIDKESLDDIGAFVVHSFTPEDAASVEQQLKNTIGVKKVLITSAGCVISSHCGKKSLGISYIVK